MAQSVAKGIEAAGGSPVVLQVAETLSPEILGKMGAPPKPDVPVVDPFTVDQYDGFVFGIPTRFGMMSAQMKAFFDATGGLWQSGKLVGKPASIFVSTGTQGGGQETTALTAVTQLTHHGIIFVPVGYSFGAQLFDTTTVRGGSPWGAGCFAGADGSRQPSEVELAHAEHQGKYFTGVAKKLLG